jgi:hypothetical protein
MSGHQHALGAGRQGFQPAEHAPLAAVAEHIHGEHMLPDPRRGQDDLLCLLLRPDAFAGALRDLLLEGILQNRGLELVPAEKVKLAAALKAEEIGQAGFTYAPRYGRTQQYTVDKDEMNWFIQSMTSPRTTYVRANHDPRSLLARP